MRTQTAGEVTLLGGANYGVHQRVYVANGSGTLIDLSGYVERIGTDEDIDQPTVQTTVEFRRDASSTLSLAPLRTDSTLNRLDDGTTYSAQLDAGRFITIEVATVAIGSTPSGSDWKEIFRGYVDSVDAASPTVVVVARDLGGVLVDRWIETEKAYGFDESIETVMQQIIDDTLGAGVVTLTITGTPSFNIRTYTQESEPLMDALRGIAQLIGWDVRYTWNGSAFTLELYEPPRTKTAPDRSFTAAMYYTVTRLMLDRADVRNFISINYRNSVAGYVRKDMTTSDATSIARYGRRFFGLTEGDDSSIDTDAEASLLIGNILSDLKDPKAEMEIEAQFFWPAELGDLYRFPDNDVHFDTNQDWAVTNIRHDLYGGTGRTFLQVRGTPSGGYLSWIAQGKKPGDALDTEPWIEITEEINLEVARGAGLGRGLVDAAMRRFGLGGVFTKAAAFVGFDVYDAAGTAPLINTTLGRATADLDGPTGIGMDVVERGGNKGDQALDAGNILVAGSADLSRGYANRNLFYIDDDATSDRRAATATQLTGGTRGAAALDSSNKLVTGVTSAATADDGTQIESIKRAEIKAARAAGSGAQGLSAAQSRRAGDGGTVADAFSTRPVYGADGALPLINTLTDEIVNARIASSTKLENPVGTLSSGVGISEGGSTHKIYRHREEITVQGADADGDVAVTFGQTYQNVPMVVMKGGQYVSYSNTLPAGKQRLILQVVNATASGFTSRSKIAAIGATTAQTDDFPSGNVVSTLGGTTEANLDPAVPTADAYTVNYRVSVTANQAAPVTINNVSITVAIDTNDGGGWVERATFSYAASTDDSGPSTVTWNSEAKSITVSGLGLNDDIRLRVKAESLDQGGSYEVRGADGAGSNPDTRNGVTYTTSSDTYESAIPNAGDSVVWAAQEVV